MLITVIVPIYNGEKTIERCVNSILEQTYGEIQIVLVNDGSSDNTDSICRKFQEHNSQIKYICIPNGGVAEARNRGLEEADGEFIAFVDADDYLSPNMYKNLIDKILETKADLVICGYTNIDENGKMEVVYGNKTVVGKDDVLEYLADNFNEGAISSPCNKLYKRKLITEKFPKQVSLGEDLLFNVRYIKNVNSIAICEDTSYQYLRYGENSLTLSYKAHYFDDMCKICQEAKSVLLEYGVKEQRILPIYYKLIYYTLHFMVMDLEKSGVQIAKERMDYYLSSKIVQQASSTILFQYGILFWLCNKFISYRCKTMLTLVCRIRIKHKKRGIKHENNRY